METPLYMRVRGRVLGPYEPEKLQAMVRRGQLSRLHELSTDGLSWARASNYPELFAPSGDLPSAALESGNDRQTAQASANQAAPTGASISSAWDPAPLSQSGAQWHYTSRGTQAGPVDFAVLCLMASNGQLLPDDLVWSEGMASWQPARGVNGLVWPSMQSIPSTSPIRQQSGSGTATAITEGELPESLVRVATGSRGWVMFVSIVMFLMAGLSALGGIALMIEGARLRTNQSVAGGVFSLLTAVVIAVGGFLLLGHASRLGGLRYSRTPFLLERALEALRIFWLYAGICLIVWLVFVVILIVLGAANY